MAKQDPWDLAPVVPLPSAEPAQDFTSERGQVVRRPDGSSYVVASREFTNETATQLLNQGYEKQPDGVWAKTVATISEADAPWNQEAPVDEEVTRNISDRQAVEAGLRTLDSHIGGLPGQGAYGRALIEQIPFAQDVVFGLAGLTSGASQADLRRVDAISDQYDRENNGAQRNLGGLAGFTAGLAAPGAAGGSVVRGAAIGAGYGGLYGLGTGTEAVSDRLDNAAIGAAGGAVLGGGITAVGRYAPRLAGIAGAGQRPPVQPGQRVPIRGNDEERAAARIVRTMEPGALSERQRLNDLGISPSLMDVTGGTTERLVRTAAGPAGPGANRAVENLSARQASLKPDVIRDVRSLSPVDQSADDLAATLTGRRSALADEMYPEAYAQRVSVTSEVMAALSDEPGRAALRRARSAAVARQNIEQVAEIDSLLNASPDATPEVSAGTLDRVKIAMQGRGQAMNQRPDTRDIAGGLFNRASQIDTALEGVPALAPARAAYRGMSQRIDALDPGNALDIFEDPRDFAQRVQALSPEARDAALVRVTQDLTDKLGGQRNAGTGTIDTANQAPYARENLSTLLGPDEAQRFLSTLEARVQQTQRAARVSPNTNSQTYGRAVDENTFKAAEAFGAVSDVGRGLVASDAGAIARTIDRVVTAVKARGMSEGERQAIVDLGVGSADELERVIMLADNARRQGRPLPRAVRQYLDGVRNTSGAQVADALQSALLPSRVAAEEERQQQ